MKNNLNKENNIEEIDLIQLFGFFESKIKRVFKLIFKALSFTFNVLMLFLKIIQQNAIKTIIVVSIAFILGMIYDTYTPKIYTSKMMIKPNFNSKYQLFTNIAYYNALIGNGDVEKLSNIFSITKSEAENLTAFSMAPGPENENEKIKAYDNFIKSVDTSTARMVKYDQFIEHMSVYNSSIYEITVGSKEKDVFGKLFPGFKKTFETPYSIAEKKKKEKVYNLKKESIIKSIKKIDSLKNVYIKALSEPKKQGIKMLGGTPVLVTDEEKNTKEFQALELEIKLQNDLNTLEEEAIGQDQLFEVVSEFQTIGNIDNTVTKKMKFIFPLIALTLMFLGIFGIKFNTFITTYNTNN